MTPPFFGRPDGQNVTSMSARVHVVVAHLDVVALAQTGVLPLGHRRITAIVESHHDAPCSIFATAALADLVADHGTGDGAQRTALAVALDIHLLHLLYHAAGAATGRLIGVRR